MNKKKTYGIVLLLALVMMMCTLTGCGMLSAGKKPYDATITNVTRLRTDATYNKADSVIVIDLDVENKSGDYLDPNTIAYQASASLNGAALDYEYLTDYCPVYVSSNQIAPKEHGTVQLAFRLGTPDAEGEVSLLLTHAGKKKNIVTLDTAINLDDVEYYIIPANYGLTIDRAFTTDDGDGEKLLVLDMTFTNNSDETASPYQAGIDLFQNGIQLSSGYLPYNHPENDDTLSSNSHTDIQSGKSISYRQVYTLQDDSEVEFLAKENTYTGYEAASILETKIAVAEGAAASDDTIVAEILTVASNFELEITDYMMGVDDDGVPFALFLVDFTNNSDENATFAYDMSVDIRQGGLSLDRYYIMGVSSYNSEEVLPGSTGIAVLCYELRSLEDNVDIVIIDDTHYADPIILEESYTINELLDATVELYGALEELDEEDLL